ncbi:MAG: PKD domain-containing protein [Bacteroidetes bacterium]|nr:PKD domain-containing protein [Bacteroidota bacterium]
MRRIVCIYSLLILTVIANRVNATHIVGGEIYYDDLGGGNYKIHMKVYRDCFNGIPPLDNPAFVTIYDANGNVAQTLSLNTISVTNIPPSINNPCIQTPNNVCVQEGIYETTVNLPPQTGGYYIVYQRCCRNNTILNLINPGDVGATYWEHIPGPEVVTTNSSPRFNLFPPIFICNGIPINFNHSATDPDGDQLVYSLCTPFNGLDPCCPVIGTGPSGSSSQCPIPPSTCPTVNTPPPYVSVPFLAPYSASYPLSSSPAININPTTGLLNGVPNLNGQWVVGVCVSEYRNGVLIGTHHRDFQFNVVNCIVSVVSAIQTQTQFCAGLNVAFGNQSSSNTGTLTYYWDFGDPSTLADTSHVTSPNYTYPTPGNYTVTLIANPGQPCSDTSVQPFAVYPLLDAQFNAPPGECFNGNTFNFTAGGAFQGNGTFTWNFGSHGVPQVSNVQNPSGVHFDAPGIYPIEFKIDENGCHDSIIDTVQVYQMPTAGFVNTPLVGCDPFTVTLHNSSTADTPMLYDWTFSDGSTSSDQNPTHTFTPPGVYSVSLTIVTTNGCIDTSRFSAPGMITVLPTPHASFYAMPTDTSIFDPDIYFFDSSTGGISWYYNFGDGDTSSMVNPSHHYTHYGYYTVTQTVTNASGCPNSTTIQVYIYPEFRFWVPNCFTPGNHDGLNDGFKPIVMGVEDYNFMVFNRWGEMIFKTNDTEAAWPGTYKGKDSPIDVYVWKCTFKNVVSKLEEEHVGHVTLLR